MNSKEHREVRTSERTADSKKRHPFSNKDKRQKLIKHQLFTTDFDIKSWLKVMYKQCFLYLTMIICFARF